MRKNLHIALIMDSSNQDFTLQCESNPALYKQCAVLWMDGWSRETMVQVKDMILSMTSVMKEFMDYLDFLVTKMQLK